MYMCTRIFNNLNDKFPVTARNMDWYWPVNTYFYAFPKGTVNRGLSAESAAELHIAQQQVLQWTSKYASLTTVMGSNKKGYAAVDGLNEAGLAVNGLYDSHVSYGPTDGKGHFLSANRWVQFVLDQFANVQQAIQYFATQDITIVSELLPDTSDTQSHLHLALSDAEGNSGVIEVRNGCFELYESRHDTVVTNQPDYETQRLLTAYWQYIWGQRPNAPVEHPVYSAPGGNSATQRFERASYYFTFAQPAQKRREAVYQAKSMVAACSVPVHFNPYHAEKASYTIWTNLADHHKKIYSLSSTVSMNTLSLHFSPELTTCRRLLLQKEKSTKSACPIKAGDVTDHLVICDNPFS